MRRTVLVSANVGGLDPVFPLPACGEVDSVYYTDLRLNDHYGWGQVCPVLEYGEPRSVAKRYKCQINRLSETFGYDWLAWADASFRFKSLEFLPALAERIGTDGARAALIPHPDRATVADEYDYVLRQIAKGNEYLRSRYSAEVLRREREYFSRDFDLSRLHLWSGGLWVFAASPRTSAFFDSWWAAVRRFSIFDQCALSPLLAAAGIKPVAYDVNLYSNPEFERVYHP